MKKPSEQAPGGAPVTLAASLLGISADALRKRIKRGSVKGFRRDGRVYVDAGWLDAHAAGRETRGRDGGETDREAEVARVVVEMQRTELSRLLGDNDRLNQRLDGLLKVQEREQVLRQQMQTMIERLSEQRALTPPDGRGSEILHIKDRLSAAETDFGMLKTAVADLAAFLARRAP